MYIRKNFVQKYKKTEDVPLVELCTLYLCSCQVRVMVGDLGLYCCASVCDVFQGLINSLVCCVRIG